MHGLKWPINSTRIVGLVLFPDVLQRIARIDNVISEEGGHLLLAGRAGVGRRSALSIACYFLRIELMSPNVRIKTVCKYQSCMVSKLPIICEQMTRGFGIRQFKEELKAVRFHIIRNARI